MALTQTEALGIYELEVPFQPHVIPVAERAEDLWSRTRAERIFQRAGAVALDSVVEVEAVPETITLMDAIQQAANGDEEARRMVAMNVRTEAIEISYKAGFVMQTELAVDEQGQTLQFGQTAEDMNINSLLFASDHPIIQPRSEAETRNSMRIEDVRRQGLLDKYSFVVFSPCAEASDEELSTLGFFAETKSMAIQVTRQKEDGTLSLESAFVAGVVDRDAPRHDRQALTILGHELGVEYGNATDAGIIDNPVLIHNSLLQNGVIDIVQRLDDITTHVTGTETFYGQAKPKQDYLKHKQVCQTRTEELESRVQAAVNNLIEEAATIKNPVEATWRLHKLTEAQMVHEAFNDKTIDARVFGAAAAFHIEQARMYHQEGDTQSVQTALKQATNAARSSSCPSAMKKNNESPDGSPDQDEIENTEEGVCKEVKDGETVKCPSCKKMVRAIVPSKEEIYCSNSDCDLAHPKLKQNHQND